jgi:hypothetical protein
MPIILLFAGSLLLSSVGGLRNDAVSNSNLKSTVLTPSRRGFIQSTTLNGFFGIGATLSRPKPGYSSSENIDLDRNEFYVKWRYAQAADILPYIFSTAEAKNVDSILKAMDRFGDYYPMYKLGNEKGLILESEISAMRSKPLVAVEIGTFMGYSALRTARSLAPGGHLYCIEFNPMHIEVAKEISNVCWTDRQS